MRQPTFSRARRVRQQRLLRTGIGVVIAVAIIAVIVNLFGSNDTPPIPAETPIVAFKAKGVGYTEAGGEKRQARIRKDLIVSQRDEIVTILNDIYQQSFVNPSVFADVEGAFPPDGIQARFSPDARATLADEKTLGSLTLGPDRALYSRVEPDTTSAKITIYFGKGGDARFAVADVTFAARGTLKSADAEPVAIEQTATFHLTKTGDGWIVSFYKAKQTQDSLEPSPEESAS